MILSEFAKFLQTKDDEIINNKSSIKYLCQWIKEILKRPPANNTEKVIHTEIALGENKLGDYILIGRSESGRILVEALYNYALSYEQYKLTKWLQDKNANDFKQ